MKSAPVEDSPTFEVATIKPNKSGAPGVEMRRWDENEFETRNSSLADLIGFAYDVQAKQIISAPDWVTRDRYDIVAKPGNVGVPTPAQMRFLVRNLLADRFKLAFHNEKREMPAYVITLGQAGPKLKHSDYKGPGMSFGFVPESNGISLPVRYATISEFAGVLQSMVLERPVVDGTHLSDRFDFSLFFMPDESQFNGHPPITPKPDAPDAAPSLFEAIQQQLGLRLESRKAAVDVLAIDHIERPSAN